MTFVQERRWQHAGRATSVAWWRDLVAVFGAVLATLCVAVPVARAQMCTGVVLADGLTCSANTPLLDPVEANAFAFEPETSDVAGININAANLRDGGGFDIPTGAKASPLFGAVPFTQKLLLMEEFGGEPLPAANAVVPGTPFPAPPDAGSCPGSPQLDAFLTQGIFPYPTRTANTQAQNPWKPEIETFIGRPLLHPPAEGRPPGEGWAHQRWNEFFPQTYVKTAQMCARTNRGLRDSMQLHGYAAGEWGPTGLYHNTTGLPGFAGTAAGIQPRFHPNMPVQEPTALWTWDGTFPGKLLMVRYGFPLVLRHYNALPIDPAANHGFGLHTLTTHEHNGHNPAESDGFAQAFFFPGQFYDYRWPLALAGHDSINTTASDPRAGTPDGQGGIIRIRGDWRETMSTHWFHDHMLDFTAPNVYKGNIAVMNYYSALDRGREPASAAEAAGGPATPGYGCHYANANNVNLCLPSGSALDWGNRSYDTQLVISDKAWDERGQLFFNIFNTDGFLGDQVLVNFTWKPFLNVRARRHRFRFLNGAVARFFKIALVTESNQPVPFHLVANDGNLMEHTVSFPNGTLPEQGIAERYDIVVDFSRFAPGTKLYLVNLLEHQNGRRPQREVPLQDVLSGAYQAVRSGDRWTGGDPTVGKFLEIRVVAYDGVDRSMNPADYVAGGKKMIPLPAITQAEMDNALHRTFSFGRSSGTDEAPWTIKTDGGQGFNMDPRRVSAAPTRGTLELWHLENGGGGWSHPIHVHFEEARILKRGGLPPPEWERWARKDMFRIGPLPDSLDSVDIAIRFREFLGTFMEHCHNTQHEDHAMLLRWDIENPGQVVVMPSPMPTWDGVSYVDSFALPTFRSGDGDGQLAKVCGDNVRHPPREQCDGSDSTACPGACRADCTCPGTPVCGDNLVNQVPEDCDGSDDFACPGACQVDCICATLPVCGDNVVNEPDEQCDGTNAASCPGACRADCTCPPPPVGAVIADVSVNSGSPSTNFGTRTQLNVDAGPSIQQAFLRVTVSGVGARTLASARLRLRVATTSNANSVSGGRIHRISSCGWNETGVTYNTKPAIDGAVLASLGGVGLGQQVEFDVTGAIPGDGTYCFAIESASTDGVDYNSREAASGRPELLLAVGTGCTPTTCAAQGKNCGTIANGCGGTHNCGTCSTPQLCGGGGVANVCGAPACTPTTCAAQGKNCGTISNGCGGTLTCGSCTTPQTCGGSGVANVCGTVPAVAPTATVVADVAVDSSIPGTALGTRTQLNVDAGPSIRRSFLRIQVSNVGARTVTQALLTLRAATTTNAQSVSGGQIHRITSCGWSETTTTYNNQPAIDGPVLSTVGAVALGQTVSFPLTGAIPGDGTYCFAIDSVSTDGVDYLSREASSGKPTVTLTVAP